MINFFRRDLNLQKKRWHRLFISISVVAFIILRLFLSIEWSSENNYRKYTNIWPISSRFTDEVKSMNELLNFNTEDFSHRSEKHIHINKVLIHSDIDKYEFLCSNELYKHIWDIIKKYNIVEFKIRNYEEQSPKYTNIDVSLSSKYLKDNNILCIPIGKNDNKSSYVDIFWDYQNGYIYKHTVLNQVIEIVIAASVPLILLVPIFLIITILYYKVILYIIYGKK